MEWTSPAVAAAVKAGTLKENKFPRADWECVNITSLGPLFY